MGHLPGRRHVCLLFQLIRKGRAEAYRGRSRRISRRGGATAVSPPHSHCAAEAAANGFPLADVRAPAYDDRATHVGRASPPAGTPFATGRAALASQRGEGPAPQRAERTEGLPWPRRTT